MRIRRYGKLIESKTRRRLKIVRLRTQIRKLWEELTLTDLYKLYYIIDDEEFRERIENTIIERALDLEDLLQIIEEEPDLLRRKAWQKLSSWIEKGSIHGKIAKETLEKIIKLVPSLRKEAWGLLKKLELTKEDFQILFDLAPKFGEDLAVFGQEVAKLQKRKRKKIKKTPIQKIEEAIKQLAQLKKE